jgi:hypothetical protein
VRSGRWICADLGELNRAVEQWAEVICSSFNLLLREQAKVFSVWQRLMGSGLERAQKIADDES